MNNNIVWHVETSCSGFVCDGTKTTHYAEDLSFDIPKGITLILTDASNALIETFIDACNQPTVVQSHYRATLFHDPHSMCLAANFQPFMPYDYTIKSYLQRIARRAGAHLVDAIQEADRLIDLMQWESIEDLRLGQLDADEKLLLFIAGCAIAKRKSILISYGPANTELTAEDYNYCIIPILRQLCESEDLSIIFIMQDDIIFGGWDQLILLNAEGEEM